MKTARKILFVITMCLYAHIVVWSQEPSVDRYTSKKAIMINSNNDNSLRTLNEYIYFRSGEDDNGLWYTNPQMVIQNSMIKVNVKMDVTGGIRMLDGEFSNRSNLILNADDDKTNTNEGIIFKTKGIEKMRLTSDGRVGIGVTDPKAKLEVDGSIRMRYGEFSNWSNLILNADDDENSTNEGIMFKTKGIEKMRLTSDGRVGIGITDPKAKLEVDGSIRMLNGEFSNWGNLILNADDDKTSTNEGIIFKTKGIEKMRLTSNGRVGIGTNAPQRPLHVKGSGGIMAEDEGIRVLLGNAKGPNGWIGTLSNHGLYLATNSDGSNIYLDTDDNVFIGGLGSPSVRDDMKAKYSLFVGHGVLSEDYGLGPKNTWADYVFSKDYKLKPLEEVAEFIDKNHHLPNMPTQKVIAKEGYNMHDMNVKFLEKIEELTSYTIQQENKIKELTKQLNETSALQKELSLLLNELKNK